MTTVITAPESLNVQGYHVFLAGAIDMGAAENWQSAVIGTLAGIERLVLMNPRRNTPFTPDTLDKQILWELQALELAETVLMWIPSTAKAPISLFEAGLYLRSGKLMIGVGPDFYRRRNLEITALRYGVPLYDTLSGVVGKLLIELEYNGLIPPIDWWQS